MRKNNSVKNQKSTVEVGEWTGYLKSDSQLSSPFAFTIVNVNIVTTVKNIENLKT